MRPRHLLIAMLVCCVSCSKPKPKLPDFDKLTQDFVYGSLALSPTTATATGYHQHNGVALDEMLDDYSATGLEAQRRFIQDFESRIATLNPDSLDKEQQADLEIIKDNLGVAKLDLDTIQSFKHNPTVYVELAGNALFNPFVLNYAPIETRFQQITKRLERMPALFEQAKANLVDAPEIWNKVAREENDGNIDLIDKTLRSAAPEAQKAAYGASADKAVAALRDFNNFLKNDLAKKTSDWRMGKEKYARKFEYVLATGKTPDQLLTDAEEDLRILQAQMEKLAAPKPLKQALDDIAKQHSTPDTYMANAKNALEQATAFVKEKGLLTLPARGNLQVIETPEFMRGVYGVGGFNPAPALEPQLGAFYWVTPIAKTWPKDRIESKLREYNEYGIQELTIHEAMPGHWVQFEYANDVQPQARRLLRNAYSNGPYVEGWGVYAQQIMSDEGYLNHNVGLQLTFMKQMLRVLSNTILDIRLHTRGMTDKEAMDLMIKDAYQEKEEATAKLQRAQLSSCQLPTYYAGLKGWLAVRDDYKQRPGKAYSLREFNERALKESAVPLPMLARLLQ